MDALATADVLGYRVASAGAAACVQAITDSLMPERSSTCRWLACLNPHSYAVALENPQFARALKQADWLVPDGIGIVLAARFLGLPIHQRVTGADIFEGVNRRLDEIRGSVFFLGATDETLSRIQSKFAIDFPGVRIAGVLSPPFRDAFSPQETAAMVDAVRSAAPDVLWVGLTSPKQDLWLQQNLHQLNVKFAAGVGAVFDFYSGRVVRSHPVFQRLGLEWLPRLLRDPRRLWRRMFVSAPLFVRDVIFEALRQRR